MKKIRCALALAGCALVSNLHAISTNDIQLWTGSGTNRAALVIEWNSPEVFNNSTVPAPIANKTMVWGFKFNGTATATELFNAVLASDKRLYAVVTTNYGTYVEGIGYNLSGNGVFGVTDGSQTDTAAAFKNGILITDTLNIDSSSPINAGDLYWGGYYGPNWTTWTELDDAGGFASSPNRGTNQFWNTITGVQGGWEFAENGLDQLPVYDGSWLGFSVAAAGYDTNTADAATAAFYYDEQAPPSPDGTYVAYVVNTNDFAVQVVSSINVYPNPPYDNPNAVLGRPTLTFFDVADGAVTNRISIVDPPYNVTPGGSDVITEITNGGQLTVMMGRKVYHNPSNPYGIDLIVFGNSFFSPAGGSGFVSDSTDLDMTTLGGGTNGHNATVSVSPDGTNWYSFGNTSKLYPQNAYRWDDANHSWTQEQSNPTKPLDPSVYLTDLAGQTAASLLDQFNGSAGGTGYNLQESGFPWIQFVRIEPATNTYTVIDAIAAVNPALEGDALAITPDDLAAGATNLSFESTANTSETILSLNFRSVSNAVKVSAVALSDFSSFAPVPGTVLNACQVSATAMPGGGGAALTADVELGAGSGYLGSGSDLRVLQWNGASWNSQPFTFDAASAEARVSGVTNLSAFVVTRMTPPPMSVQPGANGVSFQFTPFSNVTYVLQRSTDLLTWANLTTVTPSTEESLILQDPSPPANQAFYRLLLNP